MQSGGANMADARKTPETGSAVCSRGQSVGQPCQYDEAERLREELMDYVDRTDEEDIDLGKMDELLDRINALDPLPESALAGSREAFEALFLNEDEEDPAGPDIHSSKGKRTKRTVEKLFGLAALIAVLTALLVAPEAIGDKETAAAAVKNGQMTVDSFHTAELYAVVHKRPLAVGETKEYDSVQDMLDDFGLDEPLMPVKVPERLNHAIIIEAENSRQGMYFRVTYETENEFLKFYCAEVPPANVRSTETDQESAATEKIEGISHFVTVDLEVTKIVWVNGEIECHLSGNLPYEEMMEVLYGIYED